MAQDGKHPQATFWRELFEKRPDLKPPGYEETVKSLGYPEPEAPPDCDIDF